MKHIKVFIDDVSYEHLTFCDYYIKKVITNAKCRFYRQKNSAKKHEIIFVGFDFCENEIEEYDRDLENVFTTYITVNDIIIPVHNIDLAEILLEMPDIERDILLRNVVLNERLADIALDFNISTSAVGYYKKKAMTRIKERMLKSNEE